MAKKKNNALATNRKARREYNILETLEAGLVLTGTEIKSIRAGRLNIGDGFVGFRNGEAFLYNVHISPWEQGNRYNVDPTRTRKLLLHKKQIRTWSQEVKNKGTTIVPLKVYIKNGYAKVLLGLGQGKQLHDKREDMKRRDQKREIDRALKENY